MLQGSKYEWNEDKTQVFYHVRDTLCNSMNLIYFDPTKPIVVQTDASGQGLGAVLLLNKAPVVFASRSLTETEKRYSQIEREMLGIVFGLTKFKSYLFGTKFSLMTDHKPIVQLFSKPIDSLSNRLQRWLVAIQHFACDVCHIKGTDNVLADALSRNPMPNKVQSVAEEANHIICFVEAPVDLKEVATHTQSDKMLSAVIKAMSNDWKTHESKQLRSFYAKRDELTLEYTKGQVVPILCKGS